MIQLKGDKVCLRALEPEDVDVLYCWENDPSVWEVSETIAPFSRETLRRFIENQQYDIYRTRQLRLIVCSVVDDVPIGMVDLFDFDPYNLRAGVGILIYAEPNRRQGYASESLSLLSEYARNVLGMKQLHCNVRVGNQPSISLFQSNGFEQSGLKREWSRMGDVWQDEYFFQKIFQ